MHTATSYRTKETLKSVALGILIAVVLVGFGWLIIDAREADRLFKQSITPAVRVDLDATRARLERAPPRTLLLYRSRMGESIVGVMGAHDTGDANRRMVMPCRGSDYPDWVDLKDDHFLVGVKLITEPGTLPYGGMLVRCAESIPVTAIGSRPLEAYQKR